MSVKPGARRPLAVFGFSWLAWMLLAARFVAVWNLPLALLSAAVFFSFLYFEKRRLRRSPPPQTKEIRGPQNRRTPFLLRILRGLAVAKYSGILLFFAAGTLALLVRCGYDFVFVRPLEMLADSEHVVTAHVVELRPGPAEEIVYATLRLRTLDGEKAPAGCRVEVTAPDALRMGDVVESTLYFTLRTGSAGAAGRAKGMPLRAFSRGVPVVTGRELTPLCRLRMAQYAIGDSILARLPRRLSSVAAAMAAGDRRYLSYNTSDAYRAAGLSHMLVVSGLHLSVLCGALYGVLGSQLHGRKVPVICLLFVLFFVAFTGFTPSVVRSGVVYALVFGAQLFGRRADVFTSLGVGALLLCLQNPYAAADVGLQLSFAATLGALASAKTLAWLWHRIQPTGRYAYVTCETENAAVPWLWVRFLHTTLGLLCSSIFVNIFTLPVLVLAGAGISLVGIPLNVIALPLLTPIVLSGFLMAIPAGVPVLGWLGGGAAVVCGVLLRLLELLSNLCAAIPGAVLPLNGWFAFAVVVLVYGLVLLSVFQVRLCRPRAAVAFALTAALLLPASLVASRTMTAGTVRVTLAGSGSSASVVVVRDGQAVILYRGRQSAVAVRRVLTAQNVRETVLLVDMRATDESTEYENRFSPAQVLYAEEFVSQKILTPVLGVEVYMMKQAQGLLACVDVDGFKICTVRGRIEMSEFPAVDVLIPGSGEVVGAYTHLLTTDAPPDWAPPDSVMAGESGLGLWLRPGKSVVYRSAMV